MAREVRLMRALADEGYAIELNDGVPPEPRDRMVRFASLPRASSGRRCGRRSRRKGSRS